jgi:hypothetical protein
MMSRRGTVEEVNTKRGMVAIATEDDGYTIIELLSDWNIEIGDSIVWASGYGLGGQVYENLTKQSRAKVYVQNHSVGHAIVQQQLRLVSG